MNRLANETSPYLLQHAHNPVEWYPWGEEAFAKARSEDKPVFLSIGYSACHWCHVMERESFEDERIAAQLNRDFVAIKVDREERPDIDSIYMQAVQMMTGHGGWPMSVFLTPAARPFYAGTYFPPDDRGGMPAFPRVLAHVAAIYRDRRGEVDQASEEVQRALQPFQLGSPETVTHAALDEAAERIAQGYDPRFGGFGSAPKFPPSMTLDFLMQVSWRSGNGRYREIVANTLTSMARGGMYDQVGGGFHRYSVDARWLVPHFEKMLYDNALLARLYVRAWQWTKDPFYARIANEVLGFVAREMTSPEGGFYSTLDADSEGEEGKFYVWSRHDVDRVLGEESAAFCTLYDVTPHGNWEGRNILNVPRDPEEVAAELGISIEALGEMAARGKCRLYGERETRVRPGRDEKILTGWNGWMLAAFAEAKIAFGRYGDIVRRNAEFLLTRIDRSGRILRHARIGGLLEDYAGAAWGLTVAYEAVHDRRFLDAAVQLTEQILARFSDDAAGFFDTPTDHETLLTRPKDLFDNATPGGNSVAAELMLRLALITGRQRFAEVATATIESIFPLAQRHPSGFGFLLGTAEWRAGEPREIVLTGEVEAFERVIGETFLPHRVLIAGEASADLPIMEGRPSDRTLAYVCQGYACLEPAPDAEALRRQLE